MNPVAMTPIAYLCLGFWIFGTLWTCGSLIGGVKYTTEHPEIGWAMCLGGATGFMFAVI